MLRSLWVAKTGLDAQQSNLDAISNNLANVSTTAFKRVRPVFEDLIYQNLREVGLKDDMDTYLPAGLQAGNGSRISATQRINSPGAMLQSQNPLDMAIAGNGYFQVQMNRDEIAYTRAGNFMKNQLGEIVTSAGLPVLGVNGSPIVIPGNTTAVVVGSDGVVSGYINGDTASPQTLGQIAVYSFVNPAGLAAGSGGLYSETVASGSPMGPYPQQEGNGSITQYYTEQSNVNVAEELVTLIAAQRAYEITAKSVSASDQILQKLGQL